MKSSVEVDLGTGRMRSEVENTLPNPEVKKQRRSRDRGRDTRQTEDTRKGHKPMEQVTLHTETSDGCVVTDALGAKGQEETKQKDNMEVNQTETPELAQNKMANKESANENKGEDEKMEHSREGVPEPSSEDKQNETLPSHVLEMGHKITEELKLCDIPSCVLEVVHNTTEEFKLCDIPSLDSTFGCLLTVGEVYAMDSTDVGDEHTDDDTP